MKTILIPVDFSDSSVNALNYAVMLADKLNAKLVLYHSFYSPHSGGHLSMNDADEGKRTGMELALKELGDLFHDSNPVAGQEVEYVSNANELRGELPLLVKERNIDLIVMGTHGIGRLAGKIFGTNTSWTIEHIPCPVLAIPETVVPLGIQHIAYASEYADSDLVNLKQVETLAAAFGANLTVVHVNHETRDKESGFAEDFNHKLTEAGLVNLRFRTLVSANVEGALEAYILQDGVDLMVMSAREHGLYDKLLGKSLTRLMVQHLHSAMLFFHR